VCMSITSTVSYLSTGLAGCLVGSGISRNARKLVRIPRGIKKKSNLDCFIVNSGHIWIDQRIFFFKV
jgi:hypothetical protein